MRAMILLLFLGFSSVQAAALSINDEIAVLEREVVRVLDPKNGRNTKLANTLNREIARRKLWVARIREDRFIFVNVVDQHVRVIDNGELVIYEKVIVGKDEMPTPEFSDTVESVVINPVWNVPPDIAAGFLERMRGTGIWGGYTILVDGEPTKDLSSITDDTKFRIVQDPSSRNALGRFKFNSPNAYGVYLHDTPNKELFEVADRKFSAGCIRMQNPETLVRYLLGLDPDHLARNPNNINTQLQLSEPIKIYIVRWNIIVDENGVIRYK